jgi:hypothetical protein
MVPGSVGGSAKESGAMKKRILWMMAGCSGAHGNRLCDTFYHGHLIEEHLVAIRWTFCAIVTCMGWHGLVVVPPG